MPLSVASCSRHDLAISQMSGRKEGLHILWIVRIDKVYRPQTNHDALLTSSCIALLLILSIHSSMNLLKQRKDRLNLAVLLCNSLDIIKVTLDKIGAIHRTLRNLPGYRLKAGTTPARRDFAALSSEELYCSLSWSFQYSICRARWSGPAAPRVMYFLATLEAPRES